MKEDEHTPIESRADESRSDDRRRFAASSLLQHFRAAS